MSSLEEIRAERIRKLNILKEAGIDPYPIKTKRDFSVSEALADFSKLSKRKKPLYLAGRVMAIRGHGGSVFFDINDGSTSLTTGGSSKIQAYIKKDEVGEKEHKLFLDTVDIGDFVELKGSLFVTKKKEKSLKIKEWKMLAKSLRSLPSSWHGLSDVEERFRKRYLDLLMNPEVKKRFLLRSRIITEIRDFLNKEEFLEVETPILQLLAGGAAAEPFITHHNALDLNLYLRIAPELYLKQLLIGGFTKVFEIGRNFRNEGIDATHNPEFTMLEFYEAYSDAESQRNFVEKLIKNLVKKVLSARGKAEYQGNKIDFSKKFKIVSYFDLFKKYTLIADIDTATKEDLSLKAKQFAVKVEPFESKDKIMDNIFKKIIRPKLIQPIFVVEYPLSSLPLAKKQKDSKTIVDTFQFFAGGLEIAKAFSELNDSLEQQDRFAEQEKERMAGNKEAQSSDKEYIKAMEYGMPPAGGVGIGIDRLVGLLTNTKNIKEVILFPTMKPRQ